MRTAFFHDCTLIYDDNKIYYTKGALDAKKLSEYSKKFEKFYVFTRARRIKDTDDKSKMTKSSTSNVYFNSIDSLNPFSLFFGKNKKKIRKEVKKSDFIIIRMPSYIGHVALKECKKQNKNYLVEMVACPWDALWNYGKISKKIFALPTFILNKLDLKNAKNVIYVSEKFLQKRYKTSGKNIGVSDVILTVDKNFDIKNRIKKIDDISNNKTINLLTLANIELKYKGQEYVIKAIKNLRKRGYNINYYLAGSGDPNRISKIIKRYKLDNNVYILGGVPHNKINELLDTTDIYIQPSLQEGLPRAVVEAMSRGCPIIGSNTGGIPELISKECIFKRKSVKEIEAMIISLINSKEKLKKLSIENFNNSKRFNPELLNSKRNAFYDDIIN